MKQNIVTGKGITDVRLYRPGKSLRGAINDFCVICMGGSPHNAHAFAANKEIRDCTAPWCPLWAVRPYQDKSRPPTDLQVQGMEKRERLLKEREEASWEDASE
jgi:hypothetical protein